MKCPKCGQEMEPGFVQGNSRFYFNRERTRRIFGEKKGSIPLSHNPLAPATAPAYHCPRCRVVCLEYRCDPRCINQ